MGSRFPVVIQGDAGLSVVDPHSGLTLASETAALGEALRKAVAGSEFAEALAEGLAGMPVRLIRDQRGRWILLGEGGEILTAAPGEGIPLRLAAISAMEGLTTCLAVGTTKSGRKYGIGSSAYVGALRLSCAHQQRRSASSRKILRFSLVMLTNRLSSVTYKRGWQDGCGGYIRPGALVLTSPTLDPEIVPGLSEKREERRILAAWELFRKRDLFKRNVFGGVRGYEITRKIFQDLTILFHPHIHGLWWAKRIPQAMLALEWWDCLSLATRAEYGFALTDLYRDQQALDRAVKACVQIQAIKRKAGTRKINRDGVHPSSLTIEDAIQETLKYLTKPQDVAAYTPGPHAERVRVGLPTAHLRQEAQRRSPRVFATFGAAWGTWTPPAWCERKKGVSDEDWTELTGRRVRQASGDPSDRSLDTPPINDGSSPVLSEPVSGTKRTAQVKRTPNLKDLMHVLPLDEWLQELGRRADQASDFYRRGLRMKNFIVPDIALGAAEPPSPSAKPEQALPESTGITGAA
jgi:hypothetical protein